MFWPRNQDEITGLVNKLSENNLKKWPRPSLNKTNKFKFNKRAMNKYEPGDSICNLLSLSWGLFTFKPQRSASTKLTYTNW